MLPSRVQTLVNDNHPVAIKFDDHFETVTHKYTYYDSILFNPYRNNNNKMVKHNIPKENTAYDIQL